MTTDHRPFIFSEKKRMPPFDSRPSVRFVVALAVRWPTTATTCCELFLSQSASYGLTMVVVSGTLPGDHEQTTMAHNLASLPLRLGGLGLRLARRFAPGAYWASWSDAMRVGRDSPRLLGELHTACGILDREGLDQRELLAGARPSLPEAAKTLANGSMVGSTTHLPHLNTISGRT